MPTAEEHLERLLHSGDQAARLLREAGLEDVRSTPTPAGAPALTVGRRPAR
jgi:hypothetical protein